jgi:hypothetical protein
VVSRAHSFKNHFSKEVNNDAFLCLIGESHINYIPKYNISMALLPFIVSFIGEGSLVGTPNYTEYPYTFVQPIRDYILIGSLPMYTIYENFYISLGKDLANLGYPPKKLN